MRITQLDKSLETIKSLGMDEYNKVYFLALVTTKTKRGSDNYVFRSKRLDYLMLHELEVYLTDSKYALIKIES